MYIFMSVFIYVCVVELDIGNVINVERYCDCVSNGNDNGSGNRVGLDIGKGKILYEIYENGGNGYDYGYINNKIQVYEQPQIILNNNHSKSNCSLINYCYYYYDVYLYYL